MKRFYRDDEAAGEVESINVANLLMLLSRGSGGGGGEGIVGSISVRASSPDRVFECKTCNRRFSSFQALGGHRASHKKPRLPSGGEVGKPRAHECSICGVEFAIGQALGGHMRRHRAAGGTGFVGREKKRPAAASLWLDLNMPPGDGEVADCRRKKIFGFEIMDTNSIVVDCFP